MTLEEAIRHAEEKAKCGGKCGEDHAQLAEWLTELQERRAAEPEKHTEEHTETHARDCISRQAAIEAHYEYCNKHPDAGFPVWSLKILEDLPSAQPEIIRCKDCIFHGLCRTSPKWAVAPKDDWYCADAERRTDEQTKD